jgi:hypothetical protein
MLSLKLSEIFADLYIDPHSFNDDALGNALDRIHEKGTHKLFTDISQLSALHKPSILI